MNCSTDGGQGYGLGIPELFHEKIVGCHSDRLRSEQSLKTAPDDENDPRCLRGVVPDISCGGRCDGLKVAAELSFRLYR